ncbi:hypothetical protein AALP_AAs65627U000300 [Arabis alpina]|uniref:Beta-hexosaminidase eukaryotic type N-terminal domain-containing protein n=1 Tax=Arabis alpina TaxID=50452 RepID=A0A087FWA3_ARAAL|nr:hypothetical protein AALP_AAs65627U000300 [Arabis alpina]
MAITGEETLSVDPTISLIVGGNGGGSPIVKAAFESMIITSLKIIVHSKSDKLKLGVDESYTLMVSKKDEHSIVGEAKIEANTVYGALRGLELLFLDALALNCMIEISSEYHGLVANSVYFFPENLAANCVPLII